MNSFFEHLSDVLKRDDRFFFRDEIFLRNAVVEAAMAADAKLFCAD